jgi:hypothetical protein
MPSDVLDVVGNDANHDAVICFKNPENIVEYAVYMYDTFEGTKYGETKKDITHFFSFNFVLHQFGPSCSSSPQPLCYAVGMRNMNIPEGLSEAHTILILNSQDCEMQPIVCNNIISL